MNKIDFMNQVVNGYLKKDLESIKTLPRKPGEAGNNNFPIALCVLSYLEYLGSFFTLKDRNNFEENVKTYIEKCFKIPSDYRPKLLTKLFRHGLSHEYFARGGVSRDGIRPGLYKNYDNKAVLDADTLLDDFLESLDKFKDELSDDNFDKRIKMAEKTIQDIETECAFEISQLKFIGDIPYARTSGATIYPGPINITRPYDPTEK